VAIALLDLIGNRNELHSVLFFLKKKRRQRGFLLDKKKRINKIYKEKHKLKTTANMAPKPITQLQTTSKKGKTTETIYSKLTKKGPERHPRPQIQKRKYP
jgi:hypothetical protein